MSAIPSLLTGSAGLGIGAAVTWGGGDFAGGMGVKHAGTTLRSALKIVLLSHGASLALLLLLAFLGHSHFPALAPVLWGLTAGFFGGISVTCFYTCLARGAMGASAAVSGLLAAAIPSIVSITLEGAPGVMQVAGFLLAGGAIWLIASAPTGDPPPAGTTGLSIASGAGFGCYFVALRMAGGSGVFWPLALSRCGSLSVCGAGLLWLAFRSDSTTTVKVRGSLTRTAVTWALVAALLDSWGNLLFLGATRAGRLDVAAVLASLYPASTILLAAWLLRERPNRRQTFGMALAAVAVVLITR